MAGAGPGVRTWAVGFSIGVALMVAILYLGEDVECPSCGGTGRLAGRAEKVRWSGTTAGVECLPCGGTGRRKRFTTIFGEEDR